MISPDSLLIRRWFDKSINKDHQMQWSVKSSHRQSSSTMHVFGYGWIAGPPTNYNRQSISVWMRVGRVTLCHGPLLLQSNRLNHELSFSAAHYSAAPSKIKLAPQPSSITFYGRPTKTDSKLFLFIDLPIPCRYLWSPSSFFYSF